MFVVRQSQTVKRQSLLDVVLHPNKQLRVSGAPLGQPCVQVLTRVPARSSRKFFQLLWLSRWAICIASTQRRPSQLMPTLPVLPGSELLLTVLRHS